MNNNVTISNNIKIKNLKARFSETHNETFITLFINYEK